MRLVPARAPASSSAGQPRVARAARRRTASTKSGQCSAAAAGGLNSPSACAASPARRCDRATLAGRRRPDARQQLHDAKTGDAVARVLRPAQQGQHVLDVRGFEKLQSAEFHERNVAPGQLHLERPAVMRGAEQHRLRLEREPGLAVLQNLLHHVARLIGLVAHADQMRPLGRFALGPQVLGEALVGQTRSPRWPPPGSAASSGSSARA